jgi:hypothetical protein
MDKGISSAGGETARHQDTRAVSGGTPAAYIIIRFKNTKVFLENIL